MFRTYEYISARLIKCDIRTFKVRSYWSINQLQDSLSASSSSVHVTAASTCDHASVDCGFRAQQCTRRQPLSRHPMFCDGFLSQNSYNFFLLQFCNHFLRCMLSQRHEHIKRTRNLQPEIYFGLRKNPSCQIRVIRH